MVKNVKMSIIGSWPLKLGQCQKSCQPRKLFIPVIDTKFHSESPRTLAEKKGEKPKWWFSTPREQRNSEVPLKIGGTNCKNKPYNRYKPCPIP